MENMQGHMFKESEFVMLTHLLDLCQFLIHSYTGARKSEV